MEVLSLAQIFGEGAYQDGDKLVIQKSSLLKLTPVTNNTPGSLLAAILITALTNFQGLITDENGQLITDEDRAAISFDNSESFELLKMIPWQPFLSARNNQSYIFNQIIVFTYAPN